MKHFRALLLVTSVACASKQPASVASPAPVAGARPAWDTAFTVQQRSVAVAADRAAIDAIVLEGSARSHVAADLAYLTDVIGPRLTASAAMKRANDWTASKFREYGMDSTWLESWRFGRGWERGSIAVRMVAPHARWLHAASWAWAPGTSGPVTGDVVYVNATTREDFNARFAGRLRGKWVLQRGPVFLWNPDGPQASHADSVNLDSLKRAALLPTTPFRDSTNAVLANEGIAGLVGAGGKEFGLLNMSGSPARIYPFPYFVVDNETFGQMHRLLANGERVTIEANIQNSFTSDSVIVYNTVAEIRGSERPDEVVLLGAHMDSWDLGTGATDNATGSIAVLEAARILKASGVRPRRTIRFALFSGEEEGLYGSKMYAQAHAAELGKFQAVLVLDNGTGRITGMALQGRNELRDLWRELFAPVAAMGPFHVRAGNKGGTDHLSFVPFGVPSFNYDQESRGYDHTHHSQIDTFDHAVLPDLRQAATVMAATAYELAQLGELLGRSR
jgi:carboxypeptidase Q